VSYFTKVNRPRLDFARSLTSRRFQELSLWTSNYPNNY